MYCVNFLILFQVSHKMEKPLSHVAKATEKGRNVDEDIKGLFISKSTDDTFNTEPPQTFNTEPPQIMDDVMGLIKKRIECIENDMKNKEQTKLIESFLKRSDTSCSPSICPDIIHSSSVSCGQYSDLKLKGGGTDNLKLKRFTSDNNNVNLALNALRSSSLLNTVYVLPIVYL